MVTRSIVRWLLERVDADDIFWTVRRRGWVPVPKAYAERAFPGQIASGWWPVNGEQFTIGENPIRCQVIDAPVDHVG